MTPRLWALCLPPLLVVFLLGYLLRLVFGGMAAGCTFVVGNLKWFAIPFAYALRRAKGFYKIHGAWVKPRDPNHRKAVRVTYVKRRGGWERES